MYGIICMFDEVTEEIIKGIWNDLKTNNISSYAFEVKDRRPHITLASYENINLDLYIKLFTDFYENQQKIDIVLSSLGTFFNSGTLFLSPTPSKSLLQLHEKHHKQFGDFNDNPNSLYLPGKWVPHSTLANRLSAPKLVEAITFCSKSMAPIKGEINEISIIKVEKVADNSVRTTTVFSKKLK
jgi:2'-5' RNA ligase